MKGLELKIFGSDIIHLELRSADFGGKRAKTILPYKKYKTPGNFRDVFCRPI